jgi:Polysaccharide pyruvyl transferase
LKVLVAGWFSFDEMGATAGDLLARDLVCEWLGQAGRPHDVATAPPFTGGVDWRRVDPRDYSEVVFVCGPCGNGAPLTDFLECFAGRRLVGLNLSMLEPLEVWNPFDLLLERDSSAASRPDISFASTVRPVPVVGVVLVHRQSEYERGMHDPVGRAIARLLAERELSAVSIDTRLDENRTGLRTPAEVESLIARMDVVVTTRLHGLVLALKHGIPALAVDPVRGGAKVMRQAETVGWPIAVCAEDASPERLGRSFDECLTPRARSRAKACGFKAGASVSEIRRGFLDGLERMRHRA